MAERRTPSKIEERIREVFMARPQSRQSTDMSREELRSARLAEAMQRQIRPASDSSNELKARIQTLERDFQRTVEQLEEELRLKIAAMRRNLEAEIERETAEFERKGKSKGQSPPRPVRAYSTPRVRDSDEETKPKEPAKTALQKLKESKLKLAEYQTLLRTPSKSPSNATNWSAKGDSQPIKPQEESYRPPKRPIPQSEGKRRPDEMPLRPKSLYERILALQKKG